MTQADIILFRIAEELVLEELLAELLEEELKIAWWVAVDCVTVLLGLALKAIDRRSLVLPSTLAPLLSFSASVLYGPFTRLAMGSSSFGFFGKGSSSSLNHLARIRTPSGQRYLVHCASANSLMSTFFPRNRPGRMPLYPACALKDRTEVLQSGR